MLRYLDVLGDANESFLESVERGRVQHFLPDFGLVGAPRHQDHLFSARLQEHAIDSLIMRPC